MKTLVAAITVLALTAVSASAFAACGSNVGRGAQTRPSTPATTGSPTGSGANNGGGVRR